MTTKCFCDGCGQEMEDQRGTCKVNYCHEGDGNFTQTEFCQTCTDAIRKLIVKIRDKNPEWSRES